MLEFSRCEKIAKRALEALQENRPFSLIRMGDGENSVFQYPEYCCEPRIQAVFKRALEDRKYTKDEITSVKADLVQAMQRADVIGFYDSGHVNVLCRVYSEHLEAFEFLPGAMTCAPGVHFYLQQSGGIRDLIQEAEHVTLITGRDVLAKFREIYPDKDVAEFRIPSEKMFRLAEEETIEPHFPNVYDRIKDEIAVRGPKHLFLVGAGILGKAYCGVAKERGGIAIDIGSAFDYWAGIPTREGYATVKDGQLALEKPPYRPAMTLGSEPLSVEKTTVIYESLFDKWKITASPFGSLSKFKVTRLLMLAKWVGAPFDKAQIVRNYLPIGAAVSWLLENEISNFAYIDGDNEAAAIAATINHCSQTVRCRPHKFSGSGSSESLAIFTSKRDLLPEVTASINTALQLRPRTVFFADFRLYDDFKHELAGYEALDLKLCTGTDFGTHAGFVTRAA